MSRTPMNRTLRRTMIGGLAAVTLTGAIGFGATAFASDGDGSGSGGPNRAAAICNNLDTVEDWMTSRIAEVQHRIEYFTTMRAKADAAGRTELVTRIDHALARLNDRLTRLQDRLAKLDDWAATHCNPTGTEPTTTVGSSGA